MTSTVLGVGRRWWVLLVGMLAMSSACAFQYGMPYLLPLLRSSGMSLPQASVVVTAPLFGLTLALFLWGAAADRWGERPVICLGLLVAALALALAAHGDPTPVLGVLLVAAGAGGAAVHAASGRLILGWFADEEHGLAMGLRQTAQPLGVALAALAVPRLAGLGLGIVLFGFAGLCLLAAVAAALVIRDPAVTQASPAQGAPTQEALTHGTPTPGAPTPAGASPYRHPFLWRLHGASALLVVPQFVVGAFAFDYLVTARGWGATSAGTLLAASQVAGALSRIAVGVWSDRDGSRLAPMRATAATVVLASAALSVSAFLDIAAVAACLVVAAIVTVTPNGLAFTAVAERAGVSWAGRALAAHNTGQNLTGSLVPPLVATVIASSAHHGAGFGYATAFAIGGVLAVAACLVIPAAQERTFGRRRPVPAGANR